MIPYMIMFNQDEMIYIYAVICMYMNEVPTLKCIRDFSGLKLPSLLGTAWTYQHCVFQIAGTRNWRCLKSTSRLRSVKHRLICGRWSRDKFAVIEVQSATIGALDSWDLLELSQIQRTQKILRGRLLHLDGLCGRKSSSETFSCFWRTLGASQHRDSVSPAASWRTSEGLIDPTPWASPEPSDDRTCKKASPHRNYKASRERSLNGLFSSTGIPNGFLRFALWFDMIVFFMICTSTHVFAGLSL